MSGMTLSSISEATGWVMFDAMTAQAVLMDKPKKAFDKNLSEMITEDFLATILVLIAAEYLAKGWIPK